MADKQKTALALTLLTALVNNPQVTDKASALEILSLMEEMVKKGM